MLEILILKVTLINILDSWSVTELSGIYLIGVIAGSLATAIVDPNSYLGGFPIESFAYFI